MILQYLDVLSSKRIILASQSPRRRELMTLMGLRAQIHPSRFDETLSPSAFETSAAYAIETAAHKAHDVAQQLKTEWDLILAADTIVEFDGAVLEKPKNEADAVETLKRLAGKRHTVYTGVVLLLPAVASSQLRTFATATDVWFDDFAQTEAEAYVKTGEPMDKAGSYGIQGFGGMLVKKIDGCYFNVMGLPINALAQQLRHLIDEKLL